MNRFALIASLTASLALAACGGHADEDEAEGDAPEVSETTPADDTPKTDAEGNEIVSEGPDDNSRPYGSNESDNSSEGRNTAPTGNGTANSGSSATMQRGGPTRPDATPPAGSKLIKAD